MIGGLRGCCFFYTSTKLQNTFIDAYSSLWCALLQKNFLNIYSHQMEGKAKLDHLKAKELAKIQVEKDRIRKERYEKKNIIKGK